MRFRFPLLAFCFLTLCFFTACNEKESVLGVDLQDPSTLYNGICDTAFGTAYTVMEDSLLTSGQSAGLVGCYSDAVCGTSEAILYTNVTLSNDNGVEFDQYCHIDSVILSFSVASVYQSGTSDSKGYKDVHLEVYQLAETLMQDSAYYSFNETPIGKVCFFNGVTRLLESDSMVASVPLNNKMVQLLENHSYTTAESFQEAIKGLRVRVINDGNPTMLTVNLSASATRMTTYYTYCNGADTIYRTYDFIVAQSAAHYNQFKNHYSGSLALFNEQPSDSIEGSQYLYLCPMGGTNIKVSFDAFVRQFKESHPYAIIHYAELLLPVSDISEVDRPDLVVALKCYNDGTTVSIPDLYDSYTSGGYDGKYDSDRGLYRLRITQHLQKIMNSGMDLGTLLVLNGRRSSPYHAIVNGTDPAQTSNNPIRIEFVYSE